MNTRLILILLISIFIFSNLYAQTAQDYFLQGIELKEQGKIDEAIEVLKKAIEKDKKFAEAHFQLGLVYQQKGTGASLKRAEESVLDARRTGYDELTCLIRLALIYEDPRGDRGPGYSKSTWEKINEISSDNIEALAALARFHARDSERIRHAVNYNIDQIIAEIKIEEEEKGGTPFLPDIMIFDKGSKLFLMYPHLWDDNMIEYLQKSTGSFFTPNSIRNFLELYGIGEIRKNVFTTEKDSLSIYYNKKILDIDPKNRDALYRIGLIFFNQGNFTEFAEIFEELINEHPDDKDGNLFLGLAYFRLKDYDLAFEYFDYAKVIMDDEELKVFSNTGYLKEGGLDEENIQISDPETDNFWKSRDPLYLSEFNEREMEHYCRVAEANLRFSVPGKDIQGWKTDRGKILIKYGNPDKKKNFANSDILDIDSLGKFRKYFFDKYEIVVQTDFDRDYRKHDYWYYPDFTFMFEAGAFDEKNDYKLGGMTGLNFEEIAHEVEKDYPELYEYKPKGLFIDFPYDHASFRGEEGKTQLEFYFGIPVNRIVFDKFDEVYSGACRTGVFLHDLEWNAVIEDIQEQNLEAEVSKIDTSSDAILTGGYSYLIDPGEYFCSVEMQDIYSDNTGFYKDTLSVEKFGFEELQISDILLAGGISQKEQGQPVTRSNLEFTLNPRRFYRTGEPIFIYYEIYNLFIEGALGNNNFTVEYSIQFAGEEKYSVTEAIKSLFVNEQLYKDITTEFTNRGTGQSENMYLRIDHDLDKSGPYSLTLKITDNLSGKTTERSILFRLFEK
ncbi:tetratricopeptide repeat protein [candidate division KSB1 bacterium]